MEWMKAAFASFPPQAKPQNHTILVLPLKTDLCTGVRALIHQTNHKDETNILPTLPVP